MRRLLSASIASACLALCSAQAGADTLQLNNYTYGSAGVAVHVSGGATPDTNYSGGAGEFSGVLNGSPFATYCLDLYQTFNWGVTYTNYTPTALPAQMAQDLGRLVTKYRAGVDNADKSAAFQLAVWEIEYESGGGGYSLAGGVFTETGNSTVRAIAEGWLGDLGTLNNVQVQKLASPSNQDFMLATAVPEPSSYAMLIGGLGLLGFTAWRQRRQSAARPIGRR